MQSSESGAEFEPGRHSGRDLGRGGSVDAAEVEKFARIAAEWWDPEGEFKPLHKLNPVRLRFIRDRLCARFQRDPNRIRPLDGLEICDVGCGGGLLAEPLARMGANVTGLDATPDSLEIARAHATAMGLDIDYRNDTVEAVADAGETFDAVINMEVIEHVTDPHAFIGACAALVRPGGAMALSTINRTRKGFLLGVVGAEYILRWLPRGTHDWRKFVKPSEMAGALRAAGMEMSDLQGLVYNPVSGDFRLDPRDLDVNYLAFAVKNG